jgi:hypothetical protein
VWFCVCRRLVGAVVTPFFSLLLIPSENCVLSTTTFSHKKWRISNNIAAAMIVFCIISLSFPLFLLSFAAAKTSISIQFRSLLKSWAMKEKKIS